MSFLDSVYGSFVCSNQHQTNEVDNGISWKLVGKESFCDAHTLNRSAFRWSSLSPCWVGSTLFNVYIDAHKLEMVDQTVITSRTNQSQTEKAKKDAHQRRHDVTRFVQCKISLIINSKGNYNG